MQYRFLLYALMADWPFSSWLGTILERLLLRLRLWTSVSSPVISWSVTSASCSLTPSVTPRLRHNYIDVVIPLVRRSLKWCNDCRLCKSIYRRCVNAYLACIVFAYRIKSGTAVWNGELLLLKSLFVWLPLLVVSPDAKANPGDAVGRASRGGEATVEGASDRLAETRRSERLLQ